MTPLRRATLDGLRYAAYLVDYFGWEPCGPNTHLHLHAHLNIAAGKTGLENGEDARDVQGLMGHMLTQYLETLCLFDWEAEPGRTADEIRQTLLTTADRYEQAAQPLAA